VAKEETAGRKDQDGASGPAAESPVTALYGESRLGCLLRDPHWIYCHWELAADASQRIARTRGADLVGSCRWVLRVTPEGAGTYDVEVDQEARSWYLKVRAKTRYRVELGLVSPAGEYMLLLGGGEIETPSDTVDVLSRRGPAAVHDEVRRILAAGTVSSASFAPVPAVAEATRRRHYSA